MWPGAARGAHRLGPPGWAGPCCPPCLARCPPRARKQAIFTVFKMCSLSIPSFDCPPRECDTCVQSILSNLGSESAGPPQGLHALPASRRSVACPSCCVAGHASVVSSVLRPLLIFGAVGLVYSSARPFLRCQVQSCCCCCHCGHLLLIMKLTVKCTLKAPTPHSFPEGRPLLVQTSGRAPWGRRLPGPGAERAGGRGPRAASTKCDSCCLFSLFQ